MASYLIPQDPYCNLMAADSHRYSSVQKEPSSLWSGTFFEGQDFYGSTPRTLYPTHNASSPQFNSRSDAVVAAPNNFWPTRMPDLSGSNTNMQLGPVSTPSINLNGTSGWHEAWEQFPTFDDLPIPKAEPSSLLPSPQTNYAIPQLEFMQHYNSQLRSPATQNNTSVTHPTSSHTILRSPNFTVHHSATPSPPNSTPKTSTLEATPSPDIGENKLSDRSPRRVPERDIYTHREQIQFFREVFQLPGEGEIIPQTLYTPHTSSDKKRYVEEVLFEAPIYFRMKSGDYGISLYDALHSRDRDFADRDQVVLEGRGPSISIRIEWPGYRQWSRQIPTKDFRSPPMPITIRKLAKSVAKCVERFISERKDHPLDDQGEPSWPLSRGGRGIKLEDLVLVSLHHVTLGSWQPQLRLRRPLRADAGHRMQHRASKDVKNLMARPSPMPHLSPMSHLSPIPHLSPMQASSPIPLLSPMPLPPSSLVIPSGFHHQPSLTYDTSSIHSHNLSNH